MQDDKQNDMKVKTEKDDIQERCNKHNYLKLVQLITCIAKDVLVDVLKHRLPALDFGQAFDGMKKKINPLLSNNERQLLYPDNSKYSGDLTDIDISLLYIILRNVNTICPHKNGWGNNPDDDDESVSANIDRIRTFKNKYVSHFAPSSLNDIEFPKTWKEISQCIVQIGGTIYNERIDCLLISEINPVIENELCAAIETLKQSEIEKERMTIRLEEKIESLTKNFNKFSKQFMNQPIVSEIQGRFPLTLRMSGENIPSVKDIKPADFTNEDRGINYFKEGSLIIGLEVSPQVLEHVGYLLNIIDALIFDLLQTCPIPVVDRANQVIISMAFIGWNSCCWSMGHDRDWTSTSYRSTSHDEESSSISCSKICQRYIDSVYSARYYSRQQLLTRIPEIIATKDVSIQNMDMTKMRTNESTRKENAEATEKKFESIEKAAAPERKFESTEKAEAPKRKFESLEKDIERLEKKFEDSWTASDINSVRESMIESDITSVKESMIESTEAMKRKYDIMRKDQTIGGVIGQDVIKKKVKLNEGYEEKQE